MKKVSILGSTGSIGTQALSVIEAHPDQFAVTALAAGRNVELLIQQVKKFQPQLVSVSTPELAQAVRRQVPRQVEVTYGEDGLIEVATHHESHFLLNAVVGSLGLKPTLAAIDKGKHILLANKETLVMAGEIVMSRAKCQKVMVLPVDSEHSAIFQVLEGRAGNEVHKLYLTASGGALRDWPREKLPEAGVEEVLAHPNWDMGAKVTVDSATMMNKGLEVIEAHWLFDMPFDKIDVVIHPESIVHSMVEYEDGAILAQLGVPDMRLPIQYALSYPRRLPLHPPSRLSVAEMGTLHFSVPDRRRYPALDLAYEAGKSGGTYPTVLNASNEVAVEMFLSGQLPFHRIEEVVQRVLDNHQSSQHPSLEQVLEADRWARNDVARLVFL